MTETDGPINLRDIINCRVGDLIATEQHWSGRLSISFFICDSDNSVSASDGLFTIFSFFKTPLTLVHGIL